MFLFLYISLVVCTEMWYLKHIMFYNCMLYLIYLDVIKNIFGSVASSYHKDVTFSISVVLHILKSQHNYSYDFFLWIFVLNWSMNNIYTVSVYFAWLIMWLKQNTLIGIQSFRYLKWDTASRKQNILMKETSEGDVWCTVNLTEREHF